ncbi:lipocalin family protein [Acinetobacter sp. C_4_1]|uniref:lipocalin family protein n=1 Tax=unclassified Acinetobacter TaxID=196816 RepID=UPI0021B78E36|nr:MULTISPECIES: lipocalin family protein [unclassified Acinetobacter]MCT8089678.1 lipocalin family protein [Acinetobacter sp. F_3_1]MCT8098939.1 lipocalin family protein [Acinetobacter sp. C_3_1]MCT8100884.1 lipocalin family protein [Acinetobacter sp. C_4_1]MCT8134635.1 lipocalin family protein [Acinetobacter sp. T_3_1]
MTSNNLPKAGYTLAKIAVGGAVLVGLGMVTMAYAQTKPLQTVERVELDKYLGVWYEVARKPLYFQNKCDRDVTATYTLNENGNVVVDNRCYTKEGKLTQSIGEAFIQNAPFNSKLKVSFLPEAIRWLPFGRGDYWVLKLDENYQTVLVGEPRRKYMWVLSRSPQPDQAVVNEYLEYAKTLGYDLGDVIHTKQTIK